MTTKRRAFAVFLVLLAACTPAATAPAQDAAPPSRLAAIVERGRIVPRVDHHQHIVGPTAVMQPPPSLEVVALPPDLERLLQERNGIMGGRDVGELYTAEPEIVDIRTDGRPWVRGRDAVRNLVASYDDDARFIPNAFAVDGSVAWIAGVVQSGTPAQITANFFLGLKKDEPLRGTEEPRGTPRWRIAAEAATPIPPRMFAETITGDQLVGWLDVAGIERAVVLSVAYWFGSPNRKWPGDEYTNVKKENDWVAAQAARHPGRLVPFCGVAPLRDYAVQEVRRCATELGMKGLKLHFGSGAVDVLDPGHLGKVRAVFRAANEQGMAIVVHSRGRGAYGREHAEVLLKELLPAAPDVVVQIAHLWGGNQFSPEALAVFADAVSSGDPRAKNLYFDLTEVELVAGHSEESIRTIAKRIRQIGLGRILYGSDATSAQGTIGHLQPALRWSRLRARLPLTNEEMQTIASNVAPYL